MNTGGICIGCTMPGFPDRFAPFYKRPPGTIVSSTTARTVGSFIRPLRRITMQFQNREPRWDVEGSVPSGWGNVPEPGPLKKGMHFFYEKMQFFNSEQPGHSPPAERPDNGYEVAGVGSGERQSPVLGEPDAS